MTTSDGSTADYYELPEGATQLQDLISHRDMNAQLGEIFRAAYRYGLSSHSDRLRDAKKIRFYIEAEIKRLERQWSMFDGSFGQQNMIDPADVDIASEIDDDSPRQQLVQQNGEMAAEVYAAVEPVEDMSDWRNWKAGDLIEMVKASSWADMTNGKAYALISSGDHGFSFADDAGDIRDVRAGAAAGYARDFKWHSRPSA